MPDVIRPIVVLSVMVGVVIGAISGLEHGVVMGVVAAVVSAPLFGVIAARVVRSDRGPEHGRGVACVRELQLVVPLEVAFARGVAAVEASGGRVHTRDAAAGVIEAQTGMSWRSLGEIVRVELAAAGATTRVTIRSSPVVKATRFDHGKNAANVDRVATHLA